MENIQSVLYLRFKHDGSTHAEQRGWWRFRSDAPGHSTCRWVWSRGPRLLVFHRVPPPPTSAALPQVPPPLVCSLWNGLLVILSGTRLSCWMGEEGEESLLWIHISQDAFGGRNKTLTQAGLNNKEFNISHIRGSREQGGSKAGWITHSSMAFRGSFYLSAILSGLLSQAGERWWQQPYMTRSRRRRGPFPFVSCGSFLEVKIFFSRSHQVATHPRRCLTFFMARIGGWPFLNQAERTGLLLGQSSPSLELGLRSTST